MQIALRYFSSLLSIIFLFLFEFLLEVISPSSVCWSLPLDVKGDFGAVSTVMNNYRKTNDPYTANDGSQQINPPYGRDKNASFQSYILKLNPSIIINDGASFYANVSTGYNNGGFFGDDTYQRKVGGGNSFGDALYMHNTSSGNSKLSVNQFNLRIYADTATYIIGRQSFQWGLGGVYNDGSSEVFEHYQTIQDGITAKFKIGNFNFAPFWAKINSTSTTLSGSDDTKTYGLSILYDSVERDMAFGLIYGKRKSDPFNTAYTSGQGFNLGKSDINIVDLYMKKKIKDFTFGIEAPFFKGDLGFVFNRDKNTKYDAWALITDSSYKINESWSVGANFGLISGEDGVGPYYKAMYLNPNYQIANILFRYNLHAVNDLSQNLYDSYMVNTKYLKLQGTYTTGVWTLNGAIIKAYAEEVAKGNGRTAFNHSTNKSFVSNSAQDDNYGTELDFGVNYKWNSNIKLNADLAYLFVGDYFNYTNSSTPVHTRNPYLLSFGVSSSF